MREHKIAIERAQGSWRRQVARRERENEKGPKGGRTVEGAGGTGTRPWSAPLLTQKDRGREEDPQGMKTWEITRESLCCERKGGVGGR